ncbi:hypothetical protein [Streptomyces sp. NPDC097619]|uniref:hypothetical protein n=1 Tax=Streptomyces sp. NPDC097619 TaxID=3157228 RepID=UPI00332DDE85
MISDLLVDSIPALLGGFAAFIATRAGARTIAWIGRKFHRAGPAPITGIPAPGAIRSAERGGGEADSSVAEGCQGPAASLWQFTGSVHAGPGSVATGRNVTGPIVTGDDTATDSANEQEDRNSG